MNIIATVRTRDEARNIDRFCQSYEWADKVLVADGGSEDDTVKRAMRYPNVEVRPFYERVYQNGIWRNPHGKHINFLIDWAIDEGADWIIFDDCDCVPTQDLRIQARELLEGTDKDAVYLYRLYIWGDNKYFSQQNKSGKSIWAWHSSVPARALEEDPWVHEFSILCAEESKLYLEHPLACLHYFCPDEETTLAKLKFYRESGEQSGAVHPLKGCGPLAELPEWARP